MTLLYPHYTKSAMKVMKGSWIWELPRKIMLKITQLARENIKEQLEDDQESLISIESSHV